MNTLELFTYADTEVRVVGQEGEPLFVASDVARILGYRDAANMVRRLDPEDRGTRSVSTPGGQQEMTVVTEAGLYMAVLGSQVAGAREFKRWIAHEVLPAIRRHGFYGTDAAIDQMLGDPDVAIAMLTRYRDEREKRMALEAKVEADAPKVLFADAVAASDGTCLIRELAKILKGNGIDIGATRLFEDLRRAGYLVRREGSDYNTPTQKSMELGLFKVKETAIPHPDGRVTISRTSKVTGKGQTYFVERYLSGALPKRNQEVAA